MVTVKEIKDCNLIEKITTDTLKRFEWFNPCKIPLEAYQNTTVPFFAIMYNDVYVGYAILIIHNEYVAELQEMWNLNCFKFKSYSEHMSKSEEISKLVNRVCKDYCNLHRMNLLYCNVEEKLEIKKIRRAKAKRKIRNYEDEYFDRLIHQSGRKYRQLKQGYIELRREHIQRLYIRKLNNGK